MIDFAKELIVKQHENEWDFFYNNKKERRETTNIFATIEWR